MGGMEKNDDVVTKLRETITEDEKLVQGPALEGDGISQDEIDKLFN